MNLSQILKTKLTPTPQSLTVKNQQCTLSELPLNLFIIGKQTKSFEVAQNLKSYLQNHLHIPTKIVATYDTNLSGVYFKLEKTSFDYEIHINKNQIIIKASTEQGLFYGAQTLKQIFNICGLNVPQLTIKDSAHFEIRGFYHDITRSKTPKLDTLKELVNKMSFYKLNHLQLYVEHTFAFKNLPEIWADKDPLTAEEILDLDEYANKHYVELVPSLSTFGHLYELIRHPKYQHLNELDMDASTKKFSLRDRMAHYTLDVSQNESFQIVQKMLSEFIPLFKSNKFNICCDETFDLGTGKNKNKADKIGKGRLYVDFLTKIINEVKKYELKPMFWGDIILHSPELIKNLPKDLIYLNWSYDAEPTEEASKTFAKNKVTQVLCPGVSGWNRYINAMNTATSNISKMANYARKYKALGILNTDWGDCGHVNLLACSYHGMAYGAACSWANKNPDLKTFDAAFSKQNWNEDNSDIVSLLKECSHEKNVYSIDQCFGWVNQENWVEKSEVKIKEFKESIVQKDLKLLKQNYIKLKNLALQNQNTLDMQELLCACRLIIWSHQLVLLKKKYEFKIPNTKIDISASEAAKNGYEIIEEYTRLWRIRNKESQLCHTRDTLIAACNKIQAWA